MIIWGTRARALISVVWCMPMIYGYVCIKRSFYGVVWPTWRVTDLARGCFCYATRWQRVLSVQEVLGLPSPILLLLLSTPVLSDDVYPGARHLFTKSVVRSYLLLFGPVTFYDRGRYLSGISGLGRFENACRRRVCVSSSPGHQRRIISVTLTFNSPGLSMTWISKRA